MARKLFVNVFGSKRFCRELTIQGIESFNLYLPGSGKSYLAKILRDLEVENGGDAPRIHSMDDYFMTEVEKVC